MSVVEQRKMYMDIDGVLTVWDDRYKCIELSRGFGRLMRFCKIHNIKPYWLSQWCKYPASLIGLNCLLWPEAIETMAIPKIQKWEDCKADVIDYESDFVWIEDGLTDRDISVLRERKALDRFFWTPGNNPECINHFIDFVRKRLNLPELEEYAFDWTSPFSRPTPEEIKGEVGGYC